MRHSEFKNKGNRMPLMNNLDDYTPWADSMETISWLDRIACLFIVILYRKYSQRYNKYFFAISFK